jgi:SulP family sulfate permease
VPPSPARRWSGSSSSAVREVVRLTAYGSLFFASAQVVEAQLPLVGESSRGAVVVLRLRGKEDLGSTFIRAMVRYHDDLESAGSPLVLAGVGDRVMTQLDRTDALATLGVANVIPAEVSVGNGLGHLSSCAIASSATVAARMTTGS